MLDYRTQAQLVDATASMMRWCTMAAVNTSAASASRGLALWTELLAAATPPRASTNTTKPPLEGWPGWPWALANISSTSPLARTWWLGANPAWWLSPAAGWAVWGGTALPPWNGWMMQAPRSGPAAKGSNGKDRSQVETAVASYRSAGGHAVAQVIMGPANGRANGKAPPLSPV
jgi:hypothetical protein